MPADGSSSLVQQALDPARSVVVEACAGSGKTWLLASRIVRLLLAGIAPGDILAITFTRKAAREIEERVVDWLHFLATGSSAQVASFLAERGVVPDEAMQRKARGLYERVLGAQPPLAVNTFHGWFLQLVAAAPLSANLAGATLVDSDSRLFDELWQSFAAELAKSPESSLTKAFLALLDVAGLDAAHRLMRCALDRRSEWQAIGRAAPDIAASVVDSLREQLSAGDPGAALAVFFAGNWQADVEAYLGLLEMSELKTDMAMAATLRQLLAEPSATDRFALLREVLLTQANALRKREVSKNSEKRFTPAGAARLVELHAALGGRVIDCLDQQTNERILAFNRDACTVFAAFLAHVDAFKAARRQIDFVDAEWNVLRLLRDEATAAFLLARLDARYRHVLLDEFQDTNPLQWQILLAWLAAYSDAARPAVFLVGDPKQSIYRFRRAEPRLFAVASAFLQDQFHAVRCEQDVTRRNAQPIIDLVNALFLDEAEFAPFRRQSSLAGELPGSIELLPLCGKDDVEEVDERVGLRDPLSEPDHQPEDSRRRKEAEQLAAKINAVVGRNACGEAWLIDAKGSDGAVRRRPARYGDFMLLVRSRTHLACYERALSAAGIPFDAGSRGGLLAALEIQDMLALLEFLVMPADDLKLAHALRSPVFACSDDDLLLLAQRREPTWWLRLTALVNETGNTEAKPRLARAARLIDGWRVAADQLPAHDLLDRIFHEGEVPARYRRALPEAAVAGAVANLDALLQLALDVDGGRYPSLPRFIDELQALRDADATDAPDSGEIASAEVDAGRVRILTIHGAKGLEAPIVWLLGANDAQRHADSWNILVDWAPEAAAPTHFSFYGRAEDRGKTRQPLFEAEAAAARREELNLLYVAVTRARQVLIASGIENDRGGERTPYGRLASALARLGCDQVYGNDMPTARIGENVAAGSGMSVGRVALPTLGERRPLPGAAERFGILLHTLLERRTGGDASAGEGDQVARWWRDLGFSDGEYRRALPVAERVLSAPTLRRFFDPAQYRRAWNEIELTGGDGALLRLDRLVEFDAELWVLDYKSSSVTTDRLADYRAQVAAYCRAASGVFAKHSVHGALIFADASMIVVDAEADSVIAE